MSDHKPTFDTPCLDFRRKLENKREKVEYEAQELEEYANAYINDLEHALASAEAERLELYDALTNLVEASDNGGCLSRVSAREQADAAISNYRAKME